MSISPEVLLLRSRAERLWWEYMVYMNQYQDELNTKSESLKHHSRLVSYLEATRTLSSYFDTIEELLVAITKDIPSMPRIEKNDDS